MHRHQRMVCSALCSALAAWAAPAHATHTWDCLHVEPPTWEEYAGDEIQIPIGLEFYSTPVPAGNFYSYAYPSWGGIDTGTRVTLTSSRTSYTSYINYVDIPTTPGTYTIRFECVVEWSTGAIEEGEFTSTIVVLANPSTDVVITGHGFSDPATVGTETCGLVGFRNTGDGTITIALVDLDDNGVSATWGDDSEATDFTLSAGEEEWVGDPFCVTPNAAGTLTIDADITLTNDDVFSDVDSFSITVRSSPCDGVTCGDTCSGEARGYNGVPTVVGASCECRYTWEDCNGRNTTEPAVEYCSSAGDIRSHQRFTDYTCSATACVALPPTWVNDRLVQDCTRGCAMASSTDAICPCETTTCADLCEAGNVRRSGRLPTISGTSCVCSSGTTYDCDLSDTAPVRNEYCIARDRRYLDTWTDYACVSGACSGTAQSSDGFIVTCTYGCADDGSTTRCTAQPCTLVSVTWNASRVVAYTDVTFTVTQTGACNGVCAPYAFIERDTASPDDHYPGGSICFTSSTTATAPWNAPPDGDVWGDAEFEVTVTLGATTIETTTTLLVGEPDPCAGVVCADACDGATRQYNGAPTPDGATCPCVYATENCDARGATNPVEQYCKAGNELWSRQKRTDYSCTPSACIKNESWINDRLLETCDYQCDFPPEGLAVCIPESCTLVSVEWEDVGGVYAGTSVTFTVRGTGACDGMSFSYEIFEDDLFVDDPNKTVGVGMFGPDGSAVIPWITINTWPYRLNDEFGVLVTMDGQEVVTETTLTVYARDPCDDVPCESVCSADDPDTLLVGRHWYDDDGVRCWCDHYPEDCNTRDTPDGARVTFCAGGNVWSHIRFSDYTCGSGSCAVQSADWTDERVDAECGVPGCEPVDDATARCRPEPCVGRWACTTWEPSDCRAPEQTRECWDEVACPGSVRRAETRTTPPCPCALDMGDVTWENPADPEWHERWTMTVYDGDTVELSIGLSGDCDGHCVDYEIREMDGPVPDADTFATVLTNDGACADATLPLMVPWTAMYIGEPIIPTALTDLELGFDDVYAFITLGANTIRTERELNVRARTNVLGAASSVFLPYLPALPIPTLDSCFVESLPGTLIGEPPPPDCAQWEASLYEDNHYTETEELLSDVLDTLIGSTYGEVAWTGACTACAAAPALLPETAGAIGLCAAGRGRCLAIPVATAVFCSVVCLDATPGRAAFMTRELVPETIEAQLRQKAQELSVEHWRRVRLEVAETYGIAVYVDDATEHTREIVVFARSVPDIPIASSVVENTWRDLEDGPTALRALAAVGERFGRNLIIIGGGADAPRAAGRNLVVRAAHGGTMERNLNDAFDDLFESYGVPPNEAMERMRFVRSILDDATIYGRTFAPSDGRLPNDMRQISVAVDSIATAFRDDAETIMVFAVVRHEMSHNVIHWLRYRRGYREVAEGVTDAPVDELFTDVFSWVSAPSGTRRWDVGTATLRSHTIELQTMEVTGELAAMADDLVRALRDLRRPRGDEWRFLQFRATADLFGTELPTVATPIREMLTEALDHAMRDMPDDEVLALREAMDDLAQELGDDAVTHAGHVPGSDPDAILDNLVCEKYIIMENCLTSVGGATDEAGDTDTIPGPEDATDDLGTYDPDDPDGPGHRVPSDGTREKAPGAMDGTGCACDARGGADVPLLTLAVIALAVRRRRPKRCP